MCTDFYKCNKCNGLGYFDDIDLSKPARLDVEGRIQYLFTKNINKKPTDEELDILVNRILKYTKHITKKGWLRLYKQVLFSHYGDMDVVFYENNKIMVYEKCQRCSGTGKVDWIDNILRNGPED